MSWFEEGLKELGLTKRSYAKLSPKDKKQVDDLLKECGHL